MMQEFYQSLAPEGWFYSDRYKQFQKVNNKVYVYVSRLMFGWQTQLYFRRDVSYCTLEVRTSDVSDEGLNKMFAMGEEWLDKYGDNTENIEEDKYHISNPNGVWRNGKKEYWI